MNAENTKKLDKFLELHPLIQDELGSDSELIEYSNLYEYFTQIIEHYERVEEALKK